MPNITVSEDVHSLLQAADNAAVRDSIELGASDTVEFGSLEISEINFPNLTTSELNAVTNATEGDTYFDSDRAQFVRFTGAASYDVITSREFTQDDTLAATASTSLQASRFYESGLVTLSSDPFAPDSILVIFDDEEFSSGTGINYAYNSGAYGTSAGWVDTNNLFDPEITGDVVVSGKQYRLSLDAQGDRTSTLFSFNQIVASDIIDKQLTSVPLKGGSDYKIEVVAPVGDLAEGNLRFDVGYTGLYADATVQFSCDDLIGQNRLANVKYSMVETDHYTLSAVSTMAIDSPKLAIYTFTFIIRPSSDGVFTLSARQKTSDIDPLLIGKAQSTIKCLSN